MKLPKLYTISGVDGSGKSTVAKLVKEELIKKNFRAHIVHGGGVIGTQSQPRKPISPELGFFIFLKDYLHMLFQYFISIGSYDAIIYDRFLYDSVIKIAYKQNRNHMPRPYLRLIKILFPIPQVSFLLLIPPSLSHARDFGHSRGYHLKKDRLYRGLAKLLPLTIIDASKPRKEVFSLIRRFILKDYETL